MVPRIIRVEVDAAFNQEEHQQIQEALPQLEALGVGFVEVSEQPNVSIRFWDNEDPRSNFIGLYTLSTNYVLVASRRTYSNEQFRAVVLHELGHWMGMNHVCTVPRERAVCSGVGFGLAIMNPELLTNHVQGFTSLDLREFRRSSTRLP